MLAGAPEGIDLSSTGGGNVSSIVIRPTYIATSPLTISSENTSSDPLVIKSSPTSTIFTVDQSGNLALSGSITSASSNVLTTATGYTKSEVDAKITTASSTIAGNANINGTLDVSGTLDVNNVAGIENNGNVYGKSLNVNMNPSILDTTIFFNVSSSNGFNYQYFKNNQGGGTSTTILQGGEFGAFMSFNQHNVTVSQNGASTSSLTITTPNTTNPLTIKNQIMKI